MVKILIHMDGGIIQGISSDGHAEIYIIDYDIEGVDESAPNFTKFNGDECILYREDPVIDPGTVNLAKKTWETT